jgi:hypothetical protein
MNVYNNNIAGAHTSYTRTDYSTDPAPKALGNEHPEDSKNRFQLLLAVLVNHGLYYCAPADGWSGGSAFTK